MFTPARDFLLETPWNRSCEKGLQLQVCGATKGLPDQSFFMFGLGL
jgi:hypothetical protein